MANALLKHKRVFVKASHSVGKSYLAGGLVNWFFDCYDPGICITTAPNAPQVRDILWKEVRVQRPADLHDALQPKAPRMETGPDHFAVGYTSRDGSGFQGRHEEHVFIIFDECIGVAAEFWDAAEGMMTGENCLFLAMCNPTDTGSRAYTECLNADKWHVIEISALDHPNIAADLAGKPAPFPKAVRLAWVKGKLREWCTQLPPQAMSNPGHTQTPPRKRTRTSKPRTDSGEQNGSKLDTERRRIPSLRREAGSTERRISSPPLRSAGECAPRSGVKRRGPVPGSESGEGPGERSYGYEPGELHGIDLRLLFPPGVRPHQLATNNTFFQCRSGRSLPQGNAQQAPLPQNWGPGGELGNELRAGDIEFPPGSGRWWRPGPLFESRVLGRWPAQGNTSVWSEAMWEAVTVRQRDDPGLPLVIGCDVARFGDDFTSIVVRRGCCVLHHETHNGWDTSQTAGRLKQLAAEYCGQHSLGPRGVQVYIDDDGVGGGVCDQRDGYRFMGVSGAGRAIEKEAYPNKRSEVWFTTADRAARGELDLSRLPETAIQLIRRQVMAPTWKLDGQGRRVVEHKAETKRRIGRSPDDADALNLAFATVPQLESSHDLWLKLWGRSSDRDE